MVEYWSTSGPRPQRPCPTPLAAPARRLPAAALHGLATLARSSRLRKGHQQERLDLLIEQIIRPASTPG